jgi:hypothetical protein
VRQVSPFSLSSTSSVMPIARPWICTRVGEIASTSAISGSATETFLTGHTASMVRDSPTTTSMVCERLASDWIVGSALGAEVGAAGCVACANACPTMPIASAAAAAIAAIFDALVGVLCCRDIVFIVRARCRQFPCPGGMQCVRASPVRTFGLRRLK